MSVKLDPIQVGKPLEKADQSSIAKDLRVMYWKLSSAPDGMWIQLFDIQRQCPHARTRNCRAVRTTVQRNYIVVDGIPFIQGIPEDGWIEQVDGELHHDVAVVNGQYEKEIQKLKAQQEREEQIKKTEIESIKEIKARL